MLPFSLLWAKLTFVCFAAIYQIVSSKSLQEDGPDVGKKFDPREGNNISLSQEGGKEDSKGCC